ncbi:hypothetical protein NST21_15405 [Peribacillus sp. FSL K6-1552]|uniref:hypothetical protein n=1 Tax=Peribacillus sp. FSL K6-1552 TaxID=2954514 RepID=UPI0030F8FF86
MSVQFDEAAKTLAVSYIVEQDDSTYVMEIAHDTKGFYPPVRTVMGMGKRIIHKY